MVGQKKIGYLVARLWPDNRGEAVREGSDMRQDKLELQLPRATETLWGVKSDKQEKDRKIYSCTTQPRFGGQVEAYEKCERWRVVIETD